jgi:hypothetical protein
MRIAKRFTRALNWAANEFFIAVPHRVQMAFHEENSRISQDRGINDAIPATDSPTR